MAKAVSDRLLGLKKLCLLLTTIGLLWACKKSENNLGIDILPEGSILNGISCDTFKITSYTIEEDSIRTDENSNPDNLYLAGTLQDPIFGRTDASFVTNFSIPGNRIGSGFGKEAKLDSVVLALVYSSSYYGNINDILKFNVYELSQSVYSDSAYYSNSNFNYFNSDITYNGNGINTVAKPSTLVTVGDEIQSPQLRLRLKDELGQRFIDDTLKLYNTPALQNALKGIMVTTKNSVSANSTFGYIAKFKLLDLRSKLIIYYHNGDNLSVSKLELDMATSSSRVNLYKHDKSTAISDLKQQIATSNPDTLLGQNRIFLQGASGLKSKFYFPELRKFDDSGKIAVNRAILSFKIDQTTPYYDPLIFPGPTRITIEGSDQNGVSYILADQLLDGVAFDGNYNSGSKEYQFNIPYTIQKIIDDKLNNFSFRIRVVNNDIDPSRLVLGGSKNATYPMKLIVWYTKLE